MSRVSALNISTVALPPLAEQIGIVEHVDRATTKIEAAIARARRQIDLMEEYRTRLVEDVVTGKLDVRDAAELLPLQEVAADQPADFVGAATAFPRSPRRA